MKRNYDQQPYSQLPPHLRDWFEKTIVLLEADDTIPLWQAVLPQGSSWDDAWIVSECFADLFPERVRRERFQPVDVEFTM